MNRPLVIGATFAAAIIGAGVYLLLQVTAPSSPVLIVNSQNQKGNSAASNAPSGPASSVRPTGRGPGPNNSTEPGAVAGSATSEPIYEDPEDRPSIDVLRLGDNDPRLTASAAFDEANRAYDRGDFENARAMANKLLTKNPGNVRLMRIVVSSGCMTGDTSEQVAATYRQLPPNDREQMRVRCERYNVHFNDSPK
ncbi:MAG: hypothetical protein KBG15_07515 [Kofleriaceae bacterium]|nr:hypothetical protein [Kofleriaceae bacterium]